MKGGKFEAEDFKQFGSGVADLIAAHANALVATAPLVGLKTGYMGGWCDYRPDMFHYSHTARLMDLVERGDEE